MLKTKLLGSVSSPPAEYVEDVFSTFLYTGNGSTQTITNGIDLAGEGGMVWLKSRSAATNHFLFDTARGALNEINSNTTDAQASLANSLTSFNSNGFSISSATGIGVNAALYCSWTFREAPKFFDVVTYTGNGTAGRQIAHSLGSAPGMIIVKKVSSSSTYGWCVYHRSLTSGSPFNLALNTAGAQGDIFNGDLYGATDTTFTVSSDADVNQTDETFVAYLFAHNAGGFGSAGTDNVISCGSYTNSSSVTIGFEPQYIMLKRTDTTGDWRVFDSMRGLTVTTSALLRPNTTEAEGTGWEIKPTATGFEPIDFSAGTYIYMAIRRPMKPPTSGTEVFSPNTQTGTGSSTGQIVTTGFPVDLTISKNRVSTLPTYSSTRLIGSQRYLVTGTTAIEVNFTSWNPLIGFDNNTGIQDANYGSGFESYVSWNFRRATGFMDVVCYTGTGTAGQTYNHNLGVVPELMIVKRRTGGTGNWSVYAANDATDFLFLNTTAATADNVIYWNDTQPTASVFSLGTNASVNTSGSTYVAYLFASVAGVSKVGTYTGNGSSQTINCGFTAGARFVLIKRRNSTGDWVVLDTARGIVSGNDPFLELNTTAAEQTGEDIVDPDNSGFIVNTTTENINESGGSFIFMAIA